MWKIALWARLHNSEHAYRMVKHLFDLVDPDHEGNYEGGLYSNLFTAHPPFQIDANFGYVMFLLIHLKEELRAIGFRYPHHFFPSDHSTNSLFAFMIRFSAAVAEMLVQSTAKDLYLLPALPQDKWPNGCIKGLKARGRVTINICWREGDLHELGLWSDDRKSISVRRLHYRGAVATAKIYPGKVQTFNKRLKCVKMNSL